MGLKWGMAAGAAMLLASSAVAQDAPHERQARDIYAKLIGFRSAAGQGQVPAMADYIADTLRAGGVAAGDIVTVPAGEEVALLARIPGSDASARPILFSAHMDVVDARPEDWERDPYTLIEEGGNFFGRGTADNKAGVTALVSTILRMTAEGKRPKRTLVFAFIGDEETGMATTRAVAAHDWVKNSEFAINTDAGGGILAEEDGKPLIYLVQGAEKTYASFELQATNPGGHSSRPRSDNAIYDLARAVLKVGDHQFPVMANDLTRAYLGAVGETMGAAGEPLRRFAADPQDAEAAAMLARDPEFVGTTRTTCVATMLDAGHAENALPQKATATVNCRIFPGVSIDAVKATLAEVIGDETIAITLLGNPTVSPVSESRPDVTAAITKAVHARYPGVPITPYLESGGTDGLVYRAAGIPTYASSGIFMKSSEMFAHGLNERVPVKGFYDGLDHAYRLAVDLSD